MRRLGYIAVAVMTAIGEALYVSDIFPYIKNEWVHNTFVLNYELTVLIAFFCITNALIILALIQLKRSTPKLLLLFGGAVFFGSTSMVVAMEWYGLLLAAAGILCAILEISRVPKTVFKASRRKYDGLLIAAGVIAIVYAIYGIVLILSDTFSLLSTSYRMPAKAYLIIYYTDILLMITTIGVSVFSLNKKIHAGMLYLIFFLGSFLLRVILIPAKVMFEISYTPLQIDASVLIMDALIFLLTLALLILILIYTVKMQKDDRLPQQPQGIEPQTDAPPTGDFQS